MNNSLQEVAGGFYENDSDDNRSASGKDSDSESESESNTKISVKINNNKASSKDVKQVTQVVMPSAAAAVSQPKKLTFDTQMSAVATPAPASPGSNAHRAEMLTMAVRMMGAPAPFTPVSGVKRRTLDLSFSGNWDEIESSGQLPKFTPEIEDIGKRLGGDVLPVTKIAIIGYDFSAVPASLGVIAPAHFKAAEPSHVAATHDVLFTGKKLSAEKFEKEHVVFVGVESEFKKHVAKEFPGVNEKNLFDGVRDGFKPGMFAVPIESIVAAAVKDEIDHQKQEAKDNGAEYTGPELDAMRYDDLGIYHVPKPLVNVAVNCLLRSFQETNDSFNIKDQLYFNFTRTALSRETIQKQQSSHAQLWTDPRELSQFAKGGMSLEQVTKAKFTATITVAVEFNAPDSKK